MTRPTFLALDPTHQNLVRDDLPDREHQVVVAFRHELVQLRRPRLVQLPVARLQHLKGLAVAVNEHARA